MRRLLIRPGGIGDCLTCFPVMALLRAEYTEVWVPSPVVPLVQFADRVRAISSTEIDLLGIGLEQAPEPIRQTLSRFDEIVSWYGSNRVAFQNEARQLNGNWRFLPALPPADFPGHVIDFHASLAGTPPNLSPVISLQNTEKRPAIVIHPFSGGRAKNWPLACFQKLAHRLPISVEWTAGPEEHLAEAVRFDNLLELARWIGSAQLYIGNDSGITHLSAAVGVPTLALFGNSNPSLWAPRGKNVAVLAQTTIASLTVDQVLEAALQMLPSQG